MRTRKIDINTLDTKTLIYNLYLTQLISVAFALLIYFLFHGLNPVEALISILPIHISDAFVYGIVFSIIVVFINIVFSKTVPKDWMDDGGINEKLFSSISVWYIGIISVIVGFSEEFLFRGAIQPLLGVFGTSFLFTIIHFRYLKKILLITVTFIISLGLGFLANHFDWFAAFVAHSLIDFILGVLIRKKWLIYPDKT